MPTIKIKRPSQFSNRFRAYTVILDGQAVGKLRNNDEIELQTSAGNHALHLKIDWCQSNVVSFSIAGNESIAFECSSTHPLLSLYYVIFDRSNFLKLRRMSPA